MTYCNHFVDALFQYAEETYKLDMSAASNVSQLNLALARGAEKETFVFPKGPSGKVKLPPKRAKVATDTKEVCYCHTRSPSIITNRLAEHPARQEEFHGEESDGEDEGRSCKEGTCQPNKVRRKTHYHEETRRCDKEGCHNYQEGGHCEEASY